MSGVLYFHREGLASLLVPRPLGAGLGSPASGSFQQASSGGVPPWPLCDQHCWQNGDFLLRHFISLNLTGLFLFPCIYTITASSLVPLNGLEERTFCLKLWTLQCWCLGSMWATKWLMCLDIIMPQMIPWFPRWSKPSLYKDLDVEGTLGMGSWAWHGLLAQTSLSSRRLIGCYLLDGSLYRNTMLLVSLGSVARSSEIGAFSRLCSDCSFTTNTAGEISVSVRPSCVWFTCYRSVGLYFTRNMPSYRHRNPIINLRRSDDRLRFFDWYWLIFYSQQTQCNAYSK